MARYLKADLDVQPPLAGTSDHNHGKSGYPLLTATSLLDIVDGHVYWQHPRYLTDPAGRRRGFEIPNTPMVNDPLRSTVVQLSRTAMAGKPYTVSEVNHPFPNEYACEGIPILAAYAALHDWDGIYWYTLAHAALVDEAPKGIGHFDLAPDPLKMTQLAAGALVFLRGDVRPAKETVTRSYAREQIYESLRLPWAESPYVTPGFPPQLALLHATRISSLAGPPTGKFSVEAAERLISDTGEIWWSGFQNKQGVVGVHTPCSEAYVGHVGGVPAATGNMTLLVQPPFCAATLSALDDQPIARASRLLLTATARVATTGMRWNEKRTSLEDWGRTPPCIEPVTGTVMLQKLTGATGVEAQPLDATGHPLGEARRATPVADGWKVPLGAPPTTWYLIRVMR
jgi:hypothetical protein